MSIQVYQTIPEPTIRSWVNDFVPRLEAWFQSNPKRKICKVAWFYGRTFDLRRDNYQEKIARETERAIKGHPYPTTKQKGN
jgi:hypothetical protein